ncbi:lysophospholipid acyltransferase family protein [Anthocerotibacter panamensis]|uniref:lysophospholipid acyltransferase family protein n=1 Tax=Anthocerotibacter panamensis TaxID=2857077 RepID=UPI001C40501C|nr:lysophospholipid acyltransferase family protein [Anthocerotibacter panamensis]
MPIKTPSLPTLPPLELAHGILRVFHTQVHIRYQTPLPTDEGLLFIVGNHRSFLDAPLLIWSLGQPVHLICHYYLSQVPILNEVVRQLGGVHLGPGGGGWGQVFRKAGHYLQRNSHVAIFPEGAQLITRSSQANQSAPFSRGFAHLAFRSRVKNLALVPVAIVSRDERTGPLAPLRLLSLFDRQEPRFRETGWHPCVLYERVSLMVGTPRRVTTAELYDYQRGRATQVTTGLAREMEEATQALTRWGCREPW